MAIDKETDPRNERQGQNGFENKLHNVRKDCCRETLPSKADTNIPTNYDSDEIYLVPIDANLDSEYISAEYSRGNLHIQSVSLIIGVGGLSIFC